MPNSHYLDTGFFQIRTVLSLLPLASVPSLVNAKAVTSSECPSRVRRSAPLLTSINWIVLSELPLANMFQSEDNAKALSCYLAGWSSPFASNIKTADPTPVIERWYLLAPISVSNPRFDIVTLPSLALPPPNAYAPPPFGGWTP